MNASPAIALSGMHAAQTGLRTSAHNIANLNTNGFHRQELAHAEAPSRGVTTALMQAEDIGPAMETDIVGLLQSRNAFLANLAVFRTSDRMLGSLFDTSA